jgi:predicted PurR-regulated permease PerM
LFGLIASWLTNAATSFVRRSAQELLGVLLTFYLLFYLLRDRAAALETLRGLSPLSEAETRRLFGRIVDTIHATIFGIGAVAVTQGTRSLAQCFGDSISLPRFCGD